MFKQFQQLFIKFIFGCMFVRGLFVLIAKYINKKYLPYLGVSALPLVLGFVYVYFGGFKRKRGVFGEIIWWGNLRPIHAILYSIFAYLAINKSKHSYVPLLLDMMMSLVSFFIYHYSTGQLSI